MFNLLLGLIQKVFVKLSEAKMNKYILPIKTPYRISSRYGVRISPITGVEEFHQGTDFEVNSDGSMKDLYAVGDGEICYSEPNIAGSAGKVISLACPRDANSFDVFNYFHCSERYVKIGQKVKKGDLIGLTGDTGQVVGAHLHFEKHIMPAGFGWPFGDDGFLKGAHVDPLEDMDQK